MLQRLLLEHSGIVGSSVARYVAGGSLLIFVSAATGRLADIPSLPVAAFAWIAASVVAALVLGDSFFLLATQRIGVARAMPISAAHPVLTTALAGLLLGEPVGWRLFAGAALVAWGTGQLGRRAKNEAARVQFSGITFAVLAALMWAAAALAGRQALQYLDALTANTLRLPLAAVLMFALLPWLGVKTSSPKREFPRGWWLGVASVVGVLAAIASYTFFVGIELIGVARTVVIQSSAPVMSLPIAALVLREPVTGRTLLGALGTALGVVVVLT